MSKMDECCRLSIESFNKILFMAIPAEKRIDLLEHELSLAYGMKVHAMEELVNILNRELPYKNKLEEVNNIDSNCDKLREMLEEQRKVTS